MLPIASKPTMGRCGGLPKSVVNASQKEQDQRAAASVFDFLYHDSRRVGSFLSQLDQNGLLKEVRQSEHAVKGSKRGFSANVGASTPWTGGGNFGVELTPKEGGGEALERVYDPFWANARELLDALTVNNMIRRDIDAAPLGSMVLVSGPLNIIDLGMMKDAWKVDEIKRTAQAGGTAEQVLAEQRNRDSRRSQYGKNRNKPKDGPPTESELTIAFLQLLPHSLTALLHGGDGSMWCSLKEEHLVGAGSDLVLKHGLTVPGEWNMVGLLDAKPDIESLADIVGVDDVLDGPGAVLFNSIIGNISRKLAPIVRLLLGRPANAYGITPLLIFRQVGG
jgi:hypothetical protein